MQGFIFFKEKPMDKFILLSQYSWWWLVPSVLIGAGYGWAMYGGQQRIWNTKTAYALAAVRFVVVTIICILLFLNPFIRQIKNQEERPSVVFALDDSQSITIGSDSTAVRNLYKNLDNLVDKLQKKDIDVKIQSLQKPNIQKIEKISFSATTTPLSQLLTDIQNNYENRNLDKVILVSDGIHNQGISPTFLTYRSPIFTLGLGDTTAKRDIRLQSVLANKVAYLGNDFPIVAEVENDGFKGGNSQVILSQNGQIIAQKNISFKNDNDVQQLTFNTQAGQKGIQHYTIQVQPLEGEFTLQNNVRDVYVEVIDGKEKILLLASAPHPDIKALKSAIEKNENYSFTLHIPNVTEFKEDKYDLVIFYQIPNLSGVGNEFLEKYKSLPKMFVLGANSDLLTFNSQSNALKISGRGGRTDQVTAVFNKNFTKFNLDNGKINFFEKYPPLAVPFGEYITNANTEVILSQQVGDVRTERPLLVIENTTPRNAILAGEGIWQWRLEEYNLKNEHLTFEDWTNKVFQYLTIKDDKRKLRVYPTQDEFLDYEKMVFESETYNDIYERIYDKKINLSLTDNEGKNRTYTFTSAEGSTRFEISGLPKGIYKYVATSQINGKTEQASGEFVIKSLQLESLTATADHNLLKQISQKTQGKFFNQKQYEAFEKAVLDSRKPNLIHSTEDISEIINLKWIFFLLMFLLTMEWGSRKYLGSY